MGVPPSATELDVERAARATKERLPRRDDSGLTTLEMLIIVAAIAAVAGLAALAVAVVTNVVDETAEQMEGQSARKTSARVSGVRITENAAAHDFGTVTLTAAVFAEAAAMYESDCDRLRLVYTDVDDLTVIWNYTAPTILTAASWAAAFDDESTEGCVVM